MFYDLMKQKKLKLEKKSDRKINVVLIYGRASK